MKRVNAINIMGYLLIPVCLSILFGCASLEVEVAVLNPKVAQVEADKKIIRDLLPEIVAGESLTILSNLEELHGSYYSELSKNYIKTSEAEKNSTAKKVLKEIGDDIENNYAKTWKPKYKKVGAKITALDAQIRALADSSDKAPEGNADTSNDETLARLIRERQAILTHFSDMVTNDLSGSGETVIKAENLVKGEAPSVTRSVKSAEAVIASDVKTKATKTKTIQKATKLFEGNDFINSPVAYAVASADEGLWAKKYDYSGAFGLFGNTDIAIKAIDAGNFTLKGVSFNPADVAQVASKVTTQALLISAQIAGVPVNISGTPVGEGSALAVSSTRLEQSLAELSAEQAQMMGFRDALLILARTIVDETGRLKGKETNGAAVKESIDAILAVYESQKSRLGLGTTGGESI